MKSLSTAELLHTLATLRISIRSRRHLSQTHWGAWVLALVILLQPLSVVVRSGAAQGVVSHDSKWNDTSASAAQVSTPLVQGSPDVSILPAWNRLQQAALGELKVFWLPRIGTPKAIYGLMADVSTGLNEPVRAALSFLAEQTDLFSIDSVADLQLIKRSESLSGHHVFFRQTHQGLPVYGGMMGVHIDWSGRIHALVSSYVPGVFLSSVSPSVGSDVVYERMLTELGIAAERVLLFAEARRELMVYVSDEGRAHLTWRVIIPARQPLGTWEALWDAHRGERLSPLRDRNYYVDGVGRAFVPNAVAATGINTLSDRNDSADAVPDQAYSVVTLPDLDGSGFLNGPFVNTRHTPARVRRADNDFTDLDRSHNRFNEVEVYWAIDDAQRYIQSLGILAAGNYSISVNAAGTPADNSFYFGVEDGRGRLEFGLGGVDDAEDAEIIWHEYGHALLDNQVPDMFQNFQGLGEGFADYWAATNSTRHPSADRAQYDPAVGEWDATSYNPGNPPFLRRVDTDAHYPEDIVPGDPHTTGQIWSRALWDIHNAVGRDVTDQVILEGNFLLPLNPTLPEAAEAVLQADQTINDGAYGRLMMAIFRDRGLISAPTITIVTPNGGETWEIGSTRTIQWTTTGDVGEVRIEISRDEGNSFETIVASTINDGAEAWKIPGPATTAALLRISDAADAEVTDTSNTTFVIKRAKVPPIGCAATTVAQGTPTATDTLRLVDNFRDRVLARSFRGQRLTREFYHFSGEVVGILMRNPGLLLATRQRLQQFKPVIQSLVTRGRATVSVNDLRAIDRLLRTYAAEASPDLRSVIERLRHDLFDPPFQAEFGIIVRR